MTHPARRPLLAGNWKMNGLRASEAELADLVAALVHAPADGDVVVCPPATLLVPFAVRASGSGVAIGAQDCHPRPSGAHTGDLSAEMIRDAGATHVIIGHSERRTDHGESDALVRAKAEAARRAGLVAILCIGETLDERKAGATLDILGRQIEGSVPDEVDPHALVIAYEPVWAIGTGLTPTVEEIAAAHAFIREKLAGARGPSMRGVRILYGGSVKPSNALEILAISDVDGGLVGGASLKASDFLAIIRAL